MDFPPPTKKQADILWLSATLLAVALILCLIGLALWLVSDLLRRLSAVLVPMAVALILAYILNPVVEFFERKRIPRLWSVCLVFGIGIFIIAGVLGSVLPGLRLESRKLARELPQNMVTLRTNVDYFMATSPLARQLPDSWRLTTVSHPTNRQPSNALPPALANAPVAAPTNTNGLELSLHLNVSAATNAAASLNTNLNGELLDEPGEVDVSTNTQELKEALDAPFSENIIRGLERALIYVVKWFTAQLGKVTTWAEFLIGFVLVPVYLFYFLLEKKEITRQWPNYLPMKNSPAKDETVFVLQSINECMRVFFRGQVLVALCVGVLLAVGYMLLGLHYAVLLGLVAGVLGIVPYLGTIVSLLLALAVAGFQFQDWYHPVCVMAIAATVKLLEDFIISPKIIGERAGLHPLTIIVAVMVGTQLIGGFLGALLAIPLTAALRTLMYRYIWTREHPYADAKGYQKEM